MGKRSRSRGISIREVEEPDDSILESDSPSENSEPEREASGGPESGDDDGDTPWVNLGIEFQNPTHKYRFRVHYKQTIVPTRYYDPKTTQILGFRDPLIELIERIGFTGFVRKPPQQTSQRLTLEFISTVDWVGRPMDRDARFKFRLLNRDFEISLRQLNTIMGWNPDSPTEIEKANAPDGEWWLQGTRNAKNFNPNYLWTTIAGDVYNARVKASAIKHPAFRYLHRMLVYACYGRTQLGQTSRKELMALWLGLEPNDTSTPPIINYGEMWVNHWLNSRKQTTPRTKLVMGGGVTRLFSGLLGSTALSEVTFISTETLLNIPALLEGHHIVVSETKGQWGWLVSDKVWCQIPNDRVSKRFSQLRSKEPYGLPQDECIPYGIHPPPQRRPPTGTYIEEEPSTISPPTTMDTLQAQVRQLQIDQAHQTDLLFNMFSQGVESGMYRPYLNFPHYPMQQGPIPGWHNQQPTYPYYPHRPEGIDYRYPGGSDPIYDPNIPPLNPNEPTPSDYHDSVPPMEETWGSAPMPPWGDYLD